MALKKLSNYRCRRFTLSEICHPELYNHYKGNEILWRLFDSRFLMAIDDIAEFVKSPVTINNYAAKIPGNFKESGSRNLLTTTGAIASAHKIFKGGDLKFNEKWNPESLRNYMKKIGCFEPGFLLRRDKEALPFLNIRRIEWIPNMSWFHLDTIEDDYIFDDELGIHYSIGDMIKVVGAGTSAKK